MRNRRPRVGGMTAELLRIHRENQEHYTERSQSPVRNYNPGREVRITSATGGQKGQKGIRLGGADPLAMLELGRIYGMGEAKYDRFNYLKGYDWSLSIDALKRHLLAYEAGQDYDECSTHPGQHGDAHEYDPLVCDGSGLLHTAHVAWHGLALTSFLIRGVGTDDRAPRNLLAVKAALVSDHELPEVPS